MTDKTNQPALTEEQIAKRTFLKIKIRHLAVEPGIIRDEHQKRRRHAFKHGYDYSKWLELRTREHRLHSIRPEARAAQLAYAFIRGKEFPENFSRQKKATDDHRIADIALKYGDFATGTTKKEALIAVRDWLVYWHNKQTDALAAKKVEQAA